MLDGIVDPPGSFRWNAFLRNPDVSPNGRYIAMATELPDPTKSDVTLKMLGHPRATDPTRASARSRRSATRTPSGGRTATG